MAIKRDLCHSSSTSSGLFALIVVEGSSLRVPPSLNHLWFLRASSKHKSLIMPEDVTQLLGYNSLFLSSMKLSTAMDSIPINLNDVALPKN
jgi:hypothetical protein